MKNKNRIKISVGLTIAAIVIVVAMVAIKYLVAHWPFYYAGTLETTKVVISSRVASDISDVYVIEGDNVPLLDDITDSRVGVYLRVPLYDRGNAFANADKVRANIAGIHEQIINARRVVVENLGAAWNIYHSQESVIRAATAGVRDGQANGRPRGI